MEYVYLGVNFNSSSVLDNTLSIWRRYCNPLKIYIVDNYSTDEERVAVQHICEKHGAKVIYNGNTGYGAALNLGLGKILEDYSTFENKEDCIIFFGNVDVMPIREIRMEKVEGVPILNILHNGKNHNPFITRLDKRFLWVHCLAAKSKSLFLYIIGLIIHKLVSLIPSKPVAVHGSLFCLSLEQLIKLHPIFDEDVFLYSEELFFMLAIEKNGLSFVESDLWFNHIGSVSTSKTINQSRKEFFLNWTRSMRRFCEKYKELDG
jgi:GT2 family glycosyltransferase